MQSSSLKALYQINTTASKASKIKWGDMDQLFANFQAGWVVYWQFNKIYIGKISNQVIDWADDQPTINEQYLVRLRVFNEKGEMHFWRNGAIVEGRYRSDTEGASAAYIDTGMKLRGGFAQRQVLESEQLVGIVTRNYIEYNTETAQAGYVDSRFVNFINMSKQ